MAALVAPEAPAPEAPAPEAPAPEEIKEPSPFIACCIICGEEKHVLSCGNPSHSICCSCAYDYKKSIFNLITCNGCKTPEPVIYNPFTIPEEYLIYIIKKVHDFPDKIILILSRQEIIDMVEKIIKEQKNKYYYEKEFYKTKDIVHSVISSDIVNKVENLLTGIIICKICGKSVCQGDGCAALICECRAAICAICGETITESSFIVYPQYPDGHGPEGQLLYNKRNIKRDLGHDHVDAKHNHNQNGDFAVKKPEGEELESQYFDKKMEPDIGIGMHRFKFLVKELILLLNELLPKSSIEEIQKCSKLIYITFPFFYETFKKIICNNGIYILHKDITDEKYCEEVSVIELLEKSNQEVLRVCFESFSVQLESLNKLQEFIEKLRYEIKELRDCNEKLRREIRELRESNEKLRRETRELYDVNEKLRREIKEPDKFRQINEELKSEINENGRKIRELHEINEKLKSKITNYERIITEFDIKTQDAELKKQLEIITEKYDRLLIAHRELLRKISTGPQHPKYKTEECRYFQNGKGVCRFGINCFYKHTIYVDIEEEKPVGKIEDID